MRKGDVMTMLSGVILAGGTNRRMHGERMALLPFGGKPMIARQLDRMQGICEELIVVTPDPKPYLHIVHRSVRIITDFYEGHGPLGGMHAALSLAKHSSVWIVGCDMPFISSKAAELLLERKRDGLEAVVPMIAGEIYPLHGIYDRVCAPHIVPLLHQGETQLSSLLKHVFWSELGDQFLYENGVDLNFVSRIKTVEDYEAMKRFEALQS
ncbi:molybdenum cofactor guanylyltransferase [Paenibacillus roseipurpureus]|uniref:Probable molybdenum cofactor guanylyltransferase n=1 Tax=Paenibacillus roseopurpureus TaxID=2918901 RepID=A0AA96LT64_9BACL|nr:molybdenum cofactor guanylyltransferase [Paenibacillus sp. MBLB1832]WNR44230.1 molybdenum cofactor guanylyltransferase [Paenibacillus sp. MBLB1832]